MANHCFGHVMLTHMSLAVDPTEHEHRLCLFLLSPNVGLFLAGYYCDEGICVSRPGDDQDRLICPLHKAAGLLGTYKES